MKIQSVFAMTAAIAIFGINSMPAMSQSQTGCDVKLRASSPGARINVRSGPGTQYSSPHYGVAGDRVVVLRGNSVDGNVDGFAIASDPMATKGQSQISKERRSRMDSLRLTRQLPLLV